MTAEQGIEILNTIQLQMNSVEREKFQKMILNQVDDLKAKKDQCLAKLIDKHAKGQKLNFGKN